MKAIRGICKLLVISGMSVLAVFAPSVSYASDECIETIDCARQMVNIANELLDENARLLERLENLERTLERQEVYILDEDSYSGPDLYKEWSVNFSHDFLLTITAYSKAKKRDAENFQAAESQVTISIDGDTCGRDRGFEDNFKGSTLYASTSCVLFLKGNQEYSIRVERSDMDRLRNQAMYTSWVAQRVKIK